MADGIKQLDLFGDEVRPKAKYVQGQVGKDDYSEFTEKFKAKLTTDDCYTPVEVYEAALGWLREKVDLSGANIVRPFWPGGDYEAYDYKEGDVVVDNPPFSILAKILRFYQSRGIRFFLFGPQLTLFSSSSSSSLTYIPCGYQIVYANGAKVNTGFISNLFGDVFAMSAPDLRKRIKEAQEKAKGNGSVSLPRYEYPPEVLTSSMLGYLSTHGVEFKVMRDEVSPVPLLALASQKAVGKAIFGKGWLISEKKAAEKKAAEKKAAEKKAAEKVIFWELSEAEREAVRRISLNKKKRIGYENNIFIDTRGPGGR